MNITLTYINGSGKRVVKDFTDPMEIIGYIYRCWNSARNAASTRRIKERLDAEFENKNLLNDERDAV